MKYDVVIVGAGAAGLSAMKDLTEAGYRVCMLEAASVAGGRIATIRETGFSQPVETGAEFIHGKLPYTLKLLKQGGIPHEAVEGEMIGVQNGSWQQEEHDEHWDKFMHELQRLKTDVTILQFLDTHFSDAVYIRLRQAVQRFAEGFNLADISKASILSVKNEWKDIEKKQYRVKGGYTRLIDYLLRCCERGNSVIHFNACINKINYKNDHVIAQTIDNQKFEATKLIITVSLGVLQSGSIQFAPALTDHAVAIQGSGFGNVIKFLLEFKTSFWKEFGDDIGFILTNEDIPTWWTQFPNESNLLTGWLGGPKATEKIFQPDATLLQCALESLSSIFHVPATILRQELVHHKICCWQNYPYIKGGYTFNTLATDRAKEILSRPVENTIFFAGEAMDQGESQGTVESALKSGHETATLLMETFRSEKQD